MMFGSTDAADKAAADSESMRPIRIVRK